MSILSLTGFQIQKILLILILVVFIILSTSYSLYAPTFEGPDEKYHYEYIREIFENNLPESRYLKTAPLYYALLSPTLFLIDYPDKIESSVNSSFSHYDPNKFTHGIEENFPFSGTAKAVHILRIFSILFGVLTIFFSFQISKTIFSNDRYLPLFTAGIVAFTPKFTWISGVLNSDVLVWLFSTIAIFLMLKVTRNFNNYKFFILLGIFIGLANLSKSNAFLLYPVLLILFLYLIFSKKVEFKNGLKKFAIIILISIPAGSWYIFDKIIKTVDPNNFNLNYLFVTLTQATTSSVSELNFQIMFERLMDWNLLHYRIPDMLWSHLGWHTIDTSPHLTLISELGLILILGGLVVFFTRKNHFQKLHLKKNDLIIILSSSVLSLMSIVFYVTRSTTGDVRYTFPFISIFAVLITIGIYPYLKKIRLKVLLIIPILFLIIVNVSLIDTMDSKFLHGFKEIRIDVFSLLFDAYNERPDLQKAFPEVENGDFKRILVWAERHGIKETSLLKKHEALIVIVNIYNLKPELQSQFPEVTQNHDLTNLISWSITEGIDKQIIPEKYSTYLNRYNES